MLAFTNSSKKGRFENNIHDRFSLLTVVNVITNGKKLRKTERH